VILLCGCTRPRNELREALLNAPPVPRHADAGYLIACPDVLNIHVAGTPELTGLREVEANGCIDLGRFGGLNVEGLTTAGAAREIARAARLNPDLVLVEIAKYQSKQIYLLGEVAGQERAVQFEGEETVVDLLRRTGGITPDAAPDEVRIIRNPGLSSAEPQVIRVDLRAILLQADQRSNVKVQPYDQIFVPETKQARVGRCLHPWLRPLCRMLPESW
jgi:protein involved in polysaccharide export with SLBB domain